MSPEHTLHFVRHAKTLANASNDTSDGNRFFSGRANSPLSKEGIDSARMLGRMYREAGVRFDRIISSPLPRAVDTARILAEEMGSNCATIEIHDAFSERSLGPIEGMTADDIRRHADLLTRFPDLEERLNRDPDLRSLRETFEVSTIPGVESYADVSRRIRADMESILATPDRTILIVSHKHAIRAALHALGNLNEEQALQQRVSNTKPIIVTIAGPETLTR